jgi:hypothetical protein
MPAGLFRGMHLYTLPYDDHLFIENGGTINKTEYLLDKSNYGEFEFRPRRDPMAGWAIPIVTGHKYKLHFGKTGLDFESLQIDLSQNWKVEDKDIYLVHNWTDIRAAIDVKVKYGSWTVGASYNQVDNNTIPANSADY